MMVWYLMAIITINYFSKQLTLWLLNEGNRVRFEVYSVYSEHWASEHKLQPPTIPCSV
jgi:hypothetical protein